MSAEIITVPKSSIYYYVDVEAGTVVAVMDNVHDEIMQNVNKLKRQTDEFGRYVTNYWVRKMDIPTTLKGKSICSENDEFDLDFGMKLARERLLNKFYHYLAKFFIDMNNGVEEFLEYLENAMLLSLHNTMRFKNPGKFWKEGNEDSEDGATVIDSSASDEEDEEDEDFDGEPAEVESQVEVALNQTLDEMENSNI